MAEANKDRHPSTSEMNKISELKRFVGYLEKALEEMRQELEKAYATLDINKLDTRSLKAATEGKDIVILELRTKIHQQDKELKEKLKQAYENAMVSESQVEELTKIIAEMKKKCDGFFRQVTRLISEQQGSEAEICLLHEETEWLRTELEDREARITFMTDSAANGLSVTTPNVGQERLQEENVILREEAANGSCVTTPNMEQDRRPELEEENATLREELQHNQAVLNDLLTMTERAVDLEVVGFSNDAEETQDSLDR